MTPRLAIREDDLAGEATRTLLALHLAGMRADSPPGAVNALDTGELDRPGVTLFTAWRGRAIAGMAALRNLGEDMGEVKSMRTHPDHLRTGVAAALLDHVIAIARERGMLRLSLETGSGPAFGPALALYRRRGFVEGVPFGGYRPTDFNRFLHLDLRASLLPAAGAA